MEGGHALDTAIDNIHQGIDRLLNEPLSLPFYRKEHARPKANQSLQVRSKATFKIYSFAHTKNKRVIKLFYSPNKWPEKTDYYNSPEWRVLRNLVLVQFPHKKGRYCCSQCLEVTRHPHVHHVYGLNRAVFQLLCKQCHEDCHYILRVTKRLEKRGRSQVAID